MKHTCLPFACLLLCLIAPLTANAGSLDGLSISPSLQWTSGCTKPAKPDALYGSAAAYPQADAAYRQYITAIKEYQRCLKIEVKTDLNNLVTILKNTYSAEITNTKYEAQAAKQQLGALKSRASGVQ